MRPPCSSTSRFESASPRPVPSRCCDPGVGLLELLEDALVILGGDAGAGVRDRDPDLAVDPRRRCTSTDPPAGVNFTAFESRLKIDLPDPALVARRRRRRRRIGGERHLDAVLVARSRTITTPRSSASRSENGAISSSTCPASTLDRSRTSLMSESRWLAGGEDVVEVLLLLRVELAEHPLAQHLREADDRVQRRAQLVRHVRQELGLVLARGLELPVEALELVVHPVHVGRQRAELVAVA